MDSLTLRHATILPPGQAVHIARAALTPSRPKRLHQHDFFELFWVQNGEVRHHLPNGRETLTEGTVCILRPGDRHGLQGRGENALVVSLTLHPDLIAGLKRPALGTLALWHAGADPFTVSRDMRQLAALNRAALTLEQSACDTLAAEAFLLPLLSDLIRDAQPPGAPRWLVDACLSSRDPEVFRDGAAGLVAQTGRSHEHVARAMREYYGQTPTDYINALRMTYAARALTTDSAPLPEIANQIGLSNLSHFHKLFRARFGTTPHQYRQQFQRHVIQPE
ncbi:MAG: helix-turn-helix domain-containing protein [Paracoccaceae bacterium]